MSNDQQFSVAVAEQLAFDNISFDPLDLTLPELQSRLYLCANTILVRTQALLEAALLPDQNNVSLYLQRVLLSTKKLLEVFDVVFQPVLIQAGNLNKSKLRHDGGNSLNQIIGYSEMLQEDAEAAGQLEFGRNLLYIQEIAHHLLTIFNRVAGKPNVTPEDFLD